MRFVLYERYDGKPKGVLYSYRSNVLHGLAVATADGLAISSVDSVLPVVPMFYANAWGLAHAAPMTGANLVMPGPKLDGASVCELLINERVTMSAPCPQSGSCYFSNSKQTRISRFPI